MSKQSGRRVGHLGPTRLRQVHAQDQSAARVVTMTQFRLRLNLELSIFL